MSVIFILILISTIIASVFLGAFIWSIRSGQFDDIYSPSVRMLFDEKKGKSKNQDEKENDT